jgi:triosephosphate isomerase
MKKILLINLKTYPQGTGEDAVRLAGIARGFSSETLEVILSVQPTDLSRVSGLVRTFSQHIDPVGYGSNTGWILPEAVKQAGASGTLINHSERRLPLEEIGKRVTRARELGLTTMCCAPDPETAGEIAGLSPDYIAIEPPELIGGDVSVSEARPEVISSAVERVKAVNPKIGVLCGAGVNSCQDITRALELGAMGILVASAIVKSDNPRKAIEELVKGF